MAETLAPSINLSCLMCVPAAWVLGVRRDRALPELVLWLMILLNVVARLSILICPSYAGAISFAG